MSVAHQPASSTLGADILMARHGKRIVAWKLEHSGERTRAKLSDGTWDSAPNSLVLSGVSPARVAAHKTAEVVDQLTGEAAVFDRQERRFFGKVLVVWTVASALLMGGLIALLSSGGVDAETLRSLVDSQTY